MASQVKRLLILIAVGVLGGLVANLAGRAVTVLGAPEWLSTCVWFGTCLYVGWWWGARHPGIFP